MEEELLEEDFAEDDPQPALRGKSALMERLRDDQNIALREIQRAAMLALECESQDLPLERVLQIRRWIFQRLCRRTRNNGHYEKASKHQRYVEEMAVLMNEV